MGSLYDAAKHYSRMEQHFEFMLLTMRMSEKIAIWFEEQGLGPKLVHFLCGDETAMKGQLPNYNYQNPKKTEAVNAISYIICQLISLYLQRSQT